MTLRTTPLTVPEQIQDIYEQLRRRHPSITLHDVQNVIANNPCDCGCTQLPGSKSFFEAGIIGIESSNEVWYPPFPLTIRSVRATVKTSTGTNTIDINVNGTTIFTDQTHRPQLIPAALTGLASLIDLPIMTLGDYLSFDVDEGNGEDLSIEIGYLVECDALGTPTIGTGPPVTGDPCNEPDGPVPGISGLVVWLKADCLLGFSDGDEVTTWPDASGNGNDFIEYTAGGLTTVKYRTNILNGEPAVQFVSNDNYLQGPDISASLPSAATMFIVWKNTGNPTAGGYFIFQDDNDFRDGWWYYAGNGNGYFTPFRTTRVDTYPSAMPADTSTGHQLSLISSASTYRAWLDTVDKGAQTASYHCGTHPCINKVTTNSGTAFNGYVPELLIYAGSLSDTDRTNVQDYLAGKYGL